MNNEEIISANAIAKRSTDGAVAVRDPFDPNVYHTNPHDIIASMFARKDERKRQFAALGDNLGDAPLDAVKELRRAIAEDDDALKEYEKTLLAALLDLSGFKAVVVQMKGAKVRIDADSVRGKFATMLAALKAVEDAHKPPEPKHTYVLRVTCTDKTLDKICKAAMKDGAEDVLFALAQSDKAVKQIAKWFEENV